MAELIHQQRHAVTGAGGREYDVLIYAEQVDGRWQAHMEFRPPNGGLVLRTGPEAALPTRAALAEWAAKLSAADLERAFERAFDQASEA